MANYIQNIYSNGEVVLEENVYDSIFQEYERIVIQSLITSFGLDFIVKDQYGGDVDTIHNVREMSLDPRMTYKNKKNEEAYNSRGEYNKGSYHGDSRFASTKHSARIKWLEDYKDIDDVYTGGKVGFHGRSNAIPPERKAELDHIVECKGVHDDRGRVLSGLKGEDLANQQDNWAWTNKSLNASMGSWARQENERYRKEHGCDAPLSVIDANAYVAAHPDMDETTKKNLLEHYEKARRAYDSRINRAYYSSAQFRRDTAKAARNTGLKMGLRQVLGLVFTEIWFSVKDEMKKADGTDESLFKQIGHGIVVGLDNARRKYKELWDAFIEGSISGVLSSLTNTLCNIFITTAKHTARIIRQSWASLVSGTKILLLNPDFLPLGERVRAGAKIFATGASIVAGQMVSELVANTPIGSLGTLGDIVQTFCGTLVTGVLSCTFLRILDRNSSIRKIVDILNSIPTLDDVVRYYLQVSVVLEDYCAKLQEIDVDGFAKEVERICNAMDELFEAEDEGQIETVLLKIYKAEGYPIPWEDRPFDEFMSDPEGQLVFE